MCDPTCVGGDRKSGARRDARERAGGLLSGWAMVGGDDGAAARGGEPSPRWPGCSRCSRRVQRTHVLLSRSVRDGVVGAPLCARAESEAQLGATSRARRRCQPDLARGCEQDRRRDRTAVDATMSARDGGWLGRSGAHRVLHLRSVVRPSLGAVCGPIPRASRARRIVVAEGAYEWSSAWWPLGGGGHVSRGTVRQARAARSAGAHRSGASRRAARVCLVLRGRCRAARAVLDRGPGGALIGSRPPALPR